MCQSLHCHCHTDVSVPSLSLPYRCVSPFTVTTVQMCQSLYCHYRTVVSVPSLSLLYSCVWILSLMQPCVISEWSSDLPGARESGDFTLRRRVCGGPVWPVVSAATSRQLFVLFLFRIFVQLTGFRACERKIKCMHRNITIVLKIRMVSCILHFIIFMYLINNPVQNCDFPFIWTENLLRMYTFGGHRLCKQSICRFCRVNHHISTYAPEILCFEFEFLTVHHIVPSLLMKVQKRLACDMMYASAPHADMTSWTWHHRLDITDLASQTWHHRYDITDLISQTWHPRLDITDMASVLVKRVTLIGCGLETFKGRSSPH